MNSVMKTMKTGNSAFGIVLKIGVNRSGKIITTRNGGRSEGGGR